MNGRIPVWIDTDPGVDDSFAVLYALKDERLDVRGISAVMGNAEQKYTYKTRAIWRISPTAMRCRCMPEAKSRCSKNSAQRL